MIDATETFDGTWPYAPRFFEGNGFRMHYVDEGAGDTIVCLHGQPTWGYVYRHFIARLAPHHRVIVPDQIGFGKSETPQDRSYSTREQYENFERLLLHLDVRDITKDLDFVMHPPPRPHLTLSLFLPMLGSIFFDKRRKWPKGTRAQTQLRFAPITIFITILACMAYT